jgi:hypothetical protein
MNHNNLEHQRLHLIAKYGLTKNQANNYLKSHSNRKKKHRDKKYSLTLEDYYLLKTAKQCYYTGITFEASGKYSNTLDRLDNSKGYTKSNTVACIKKPKKQQCLLANKPRIQLTHNLL